MEQGRTAFVLLVFCILLLGAKCDVGTRIQWSSTDGGNDHFYEIVDQVADPLDALAVCKSKGGYPATVTSSGEDAFLKENVEYWNVPGVWLGGTLVPPYENGEWYWEAGPELGDRFWTSTEVSSVAGPDACSQEICDWDPNEPDLGTTDDFLWMDLNYTSGSWFGSVPPSDLNPICEYNFDPFLCPNVRECNSGYMLQDCSCDCSRVACSQPFVYSVACDCCPISLSSCLGVITGGCSCDCSGVICPSAFTQEADCSCTAPPPTPTPTPLPIPVPTPTPTPVVVIQQTLQEDTPNSDLAVVDNSTGTQQEAVSLQVTQFERDDGAVQVPLQWERTVNTSADQSSAQFRVVVPDRCCSSNSNSVVQVNYVASAAETQAEIVPGVSYNVSAGALKFSLLIQRLVNCTQLSFTCSVNNSRRQANQNCTGLIDPFFTSPTDTLRWSVSLLPGNSSTLQYLSSNATVTTCSDPTLGDIITTHTISIGAVRIRINVPTIGLADGNRRVNVTHALLVTNGSLIIALQLPYFCSSILFDPDLSVFLDTTDNEGGDGTSGSLAYIALIAILVPIAGVIVAGIILGSVAITVWRKRRWQLKSTSDGDEMVNL